MPVEGASLGQNLSTMGTDNSINPVNLPDVAIEICQSFLQWMF
jgi:hypothetical protein